MASARRIAVGARPQRKRRDMLSSSGFGGSSAVGRPPTASGSSAIPQIGHGTGSFSRTSGSIGQTQTSSPPGGGAGGGASFATPPGPDLGYAPGSAENFARHLGLQKNQRSPPCSSCPPFGAFGFTSIPQTGSIANQRSASKRVRQESEQNA